MSYVRQSATGKSIPWQSKRRIASLHEVVSQMRTIFSKLFVGIRVTRNEKRKRNAKCETLYTQESRVISNSSYSTPGVRELFDQFNVNLLLERKTQFHSF